MTENKPIIYYKNSRFVKYSSEYNFKGNQKAEGKMIDYKNCVEKMKKVMKFINNF